MHHTMPQQSLGSSRQLAPCHRVHAAKLRVACRIAMMPDDVQTAPVRKEPRHRYQLGELLGAGTAARVVVGMNEAGEQYAVKIQDKLKGSRSRVEQINAEVGYPPGYTHCTRQRPFQSVTDAHTSLTACLCQILPCCPLAALMIVW